MQQRYLIFLSPDDYGEIKFQLEQEEPKHEQEKPEPEKEQLKSDQKKTGDAPKTKTHESFIEKLNRRFKNM